MNNIFTTLIFSELLLDELVREIFPIKYMKYSEHSSQIVLY